MTAQSIQPPVHRMWTPHPRWRRLASCPVEDVLARRHAPREFAGGPGVGVVVTERAVTELVPDEPFEIRLPIGDIIS